MFDPNHISKNNFLYAYGGSIYPKILLPKGDALITFPNYFFLGFCHSTIVCALRISKTNFLF